MPVAGSQIFISTAAPLNGLGVLCPSCYPDCQKSAVSDASGRFTLKELDPELKFRLLVISRDFKPTYSPTYLVPGADEAVVALKPHTLDASKPELILTGRVVNESGDPVPYAAVEPQSVRRLRKKQPFIQEDIVLASQRGCDALAVTDDQGMFRLGVAQEGDEVQLLVKATSLAPKTTKPLVAGKTIHTIELGTGVWVTGKVVKNGLPLAGVGVGMVQKDRSSIGFLGNFEVGTDSDGRFEFSHMTPEQTWLIYGLMNSLKDSGSIPARPLTTRTNGSTVDLGDLEVQPGYQIEGRLVFSDGKPVPPDTRLILSRDPSGAWDSQIVIAKVDGHFSFAGVPPGRVVISTKIPEYHLSQKNMSIDVIFGQFLWGTIKEDIHDLRLLVEPGSPSKVDFSRFGQKDRDENERRQSNPLRGAPLGPSSDEQ